MIASSSAAECFGGELLLPHRAAPADVPGVPGNDLRQEQGTDRRRHAVRRHDEIGGEWGTGCGPDCRSPVRRHRIPGNRFTGGAPAGRSAVCKFDPDDLGAHPVAGTVEAGEQGSVEGRPGREAEAAGRLAQHRCVGAEVAEPRHRSADPGQVGDAVVDQVAGGGGMEDDSGAAAFERRRRPFEDLDVPADLVQPQCGVEPAEGAADHHGPSAGRAAHGGGVYGSSRRCKRPSP